MTLGHKGVYMATAAQVPCFSYGHRAKGAGYMASALVGAECVQLHGALSAHIHWLSPEHKSSTLLFAFFFPYLLDMKKSYRTEIQPIVTLSSLF